jgi:hypothetical protein
VNPGAGSAATWHPSRKLNVRIIMPVARRRSSSLCQWRAAQAGHSQRNCQRKACRWQWQLKLSAGACQWPGRGGVVSERPRHGRGDFGRLAPRESDSAIWSLAAVRGSASQPAVNGRHPLPLPRACVCHTGRFLPSHRPRSQTQPRVPEPGKRGLSCRCGTFTPAPPPLAPRPSPGHPVP